MMCPTFVYLISQVYLVKSQLLAFLFDSNFNTGGYTNHGVVTSADETHHFDASVSWERL